MNNVCAPFVGKKITMLGLGLLGRGAGDAEFFAKCGAEIIVTDKKDKTELAPSVAKLEHYPNITFHLGGHKEEDFEHRDFVLKAAGVRLDSLEVAHARASGVPVYMSTALFAKYAQATGVKIVGVTGTRGKSTITHMIHHALVHAGRRAHLGGNIRGMSTLAMLPEMQSGDIAVLELDSWQLQGFGDLAISPDVAVFSNLMTDHLNYYPGMDEYFADKANIFRYQREGSALFVGTAIAEKIVAANPPVAPGALVPLPREWELVVLGEHNRENAALAAGALRALGLSDAEIRAGLESFEGVEGRLQMAREVRGIRIYNDNNATTPEATIAAIAALSDQGKNIVLIAGGSDKSLPLEDMAKTINEHVAATVLLGGSGTKKLQALLSGVEVSADSLKKALEIALDLAKDNGIVLFSPGFASFGMFQNEYDRNDQFVALVRSV